MALNEMPDDEDVGNVPDILDISDENEEVTEEELAEEESGEAEDDESEIVVNEDGEEIEDAEAKSEEEEESYSKKVDKRIGKLVYERNTSREREAAAEKRAAELQAKLDAITAKTAEKEHETSLEMANRELDELAQELEDALSDEDAAAVSEVLKKQARKNAEILDMERKAASVSHETKDDVVKPVEKAEVIEPEVDENAAKWMTDNGSWFNDPKNARLAALAEDIEASLRNDEGYDFGSDLYEELDKRLMAAAPRVAELKGVKIKEEQEAIKPAPRNKPRSVVSGQDSGDGVMPEKPQGNRLTQDDLKSMAKYNFDPSSPSDRKAWLNRNAEL